MNAGNVISWNALIAEHTKHGRSHEALSCFDRMQGQCIIPNPITFLCALKACSSIGAVDKGKQIHIDVVSRSLLERNHVLGTALLGMYAKCGVLAKARQVHEELHIRDVVSWSALIGGYAQHGQCHEALTCLKQMQTDGISPNTIVFTSILKSCGSAGAIDKGKQIHDIIVNKGWLEKDLALGNALVDMYAKCGALSNAQQLMDELQIRDVVSWNTVIGGYAERGYGREALNCFEHMESEGLSPDGVTFLCLLNACSHSGLLNEIQILFGNMSEKYNIIPRLQHLAFMVTVFGCAGYFDQVMSVIKMMPSSDNSAVWLAVLDVSRIWGNSKLGILAFDQLMQLDNSCAISYIVMADIFVKAGMQDDAEKVEAIRLKYAAF